MPVISDHTSLPEPVSPFLKWAGGKRWFVKNHPELFPPDFRRYFEPFLGSGAVFFYLAPAAAVLSDANAELIQTYLALKHRWKSVLNQLTIHHENHHKGYYYTVRDHSPQNNVSAAARFIYLNRTCWNGLYRVNLRGDFNVPIGTKNSVLFSTDDFALIASRLKTAELEAADFETIIGRARKNDFVFLDPPYTVAHNINGFLKYNDALFSWSDQVRLRDVVVRATSRGAKVLLTNANHASIKELYSGIGQHTVVSRPSVLAADASCRRLTKELVIRCY